MTPIGQLVFCPKTNKLGYMSEDHANAAARRIGMRIHRYFRVYLCPHCSWWHLTTRPYSHRRP